MDDSIEKVIADMRSAGLHGFAARVDEWADRLELLRQAPLDVFPGVTFNVSSTIPQGTAIFNGNRYKLDIDAIKSMWKA